MHTTAAPTPTPPTSSSASTWISTDAAGTADVRLLRRVLRTNTAVCVTSGVATIAAAGWLADQVVGVDPLPVRLFGAALVVFGLVVLAGAAGPTSRVVATGRFAYVADLLWLVGSAAALLLVDLTAAGRLVVVDLAAVVAVIAVLERRGLRRAPR